MARAAKAGAAKPKKNGRAGTATVGVAIVLDGDEFVLTELERTFAEAYVDLSIHRGSSFGVIIAAMRRVNRSASTTMAYEYMRKPEVQRYVSHLRNGISERFVVNQGRIVKEIEAIAFANMSDFIRRIDVQDIDGVRRQEMVVDLEGLDDEHLSAISECRIDTIDAGPGRAPTRRIIIKLHDKQAALDKLCRIRGLYQDRNNLLIGPEEVDAVIQRLEARVLELQSDGSYRPGADAQQIEEVAQPAEAGE